MPAPSTPPPAAWSEWLARVSRPWLLRLRAAPRAALLIVLVAVLGLGLFTPGPLGGFFLLLIGLFLLWLALLAWPVLHSGARAIRIGVAVFVIAAAIAKAVGVWG